MDVEVSSDEDEEDETEGTPGGQRQDDAGVQVSGAGRRLRGPPVGPPHRARGVDDKRSCRMLNENVKFSIKCSCRCESNAYWQLRQGMSSRRCYMHQ